MNNTRPLSVKAILPPGCRILLGFGLGGFLLLAGCSRDSTPPSPATSGRATTMKEAMATPGAIRELDLYYRRLPGFPEGTLTLLNLERLTLRTCRLGALPDGISTLSKLVSLDIGETSLTNLTPAVGQLPRLRRLWLNDNALTSIPPELGQCSELTYLNLDRNQLASLPDSIGLLPNLTWLRVNQNRLTALPHDLSGLAQNLRTLYLMGNPIPDAEQKRIRLALPKCKVILK